MTNFDSNVVPSACDQLIANIERVIVGKRETTRLAVVALITGGHLLIEDVPGVGKTTLAKALARSIDGTFGRIQFTPDLLPSDVVGVNVWERANDQFTFRPGPIFANIVVADELNRASPKVQSALLEAMAERQVTIDGTTRHLGAPFLVLATENPIDHEGTYPLPESQLDRFAMRIAIGYPHAHAEISLLQGIGGTDELEQLKPMLSTTDVVALSEIVAKTQVAPELHEYLVAIAQATRDHPFVRLGMSPRATLTLQHVARGFAVVQGRHFVTPDDIRDMLVPVVAHRLVLNPDARHHAITPAQILTEIVAQLAVPRGVSEIT